MVNPIDSIHQTCMPSEKHCLGATVANVQIILAQGVNFHRVEKLKGRGNKHAQCVVECSYRVHRDLR